MKARHLARWLVFAHALAGGLLLQASDWIAPGNDWRILKGRAEASSPDRAAWRQAEFDDSGWITGPLPAVHGHSLPGTELPDMRGSYTSVFLRRKFTIDNPANYLALQFRTLSDDGFVAWLNGHEIGRFNVPGGDLSFNATASAAALRPLTAQTNVLKNARELLVSGENILAVHAFNGALAASSTFLFDASMMASPDEQAPWAETVFPTPDTTVRELPSIEVHFDEPVVHLDASDLRVNGVPATAVTEFAPGQFVFTFSQPGDGRIAVEWVTDHGITDTADVANAFEGGSWSYGLDSKSPPPQVQLSEFMADNSKTLRDDEGEDSDWIEIFNGDDGAVKLEGWFLTDDPSNLTQWRFPDVVIGPREYLVVFASEKDRTTVTNRLHTNFKLSSAGEYLALVSPQTNVMSEFAPTYPPQRTDVSYGRAKGASEVLGYFVQPTPGAANSESGPGFASEVTFSRPGGTFTAPFQLTLSADSTNAVLRYTLDGSLPTNSSPAYVGPLAVTNSVEVRVRAYEDRLLPGPPRSETYLLLSNNVTSFTSDLPVLVIHSLGKGAPNASRQNFAHVAFFEPRNGVTSLTNPPAVTSRSGIKLRGSSTQGLPKASFALELWDEFNKDKKRELLGLPEDADWVLYAPNNFEPVLIHNPFIHQLSRDIGRYSPRTRFIEVYLNKSTGPIAALHYSGIYVLEEKIKIGPNRVAIDRLQPEHVQSPEVTGGYLLKVDRLDPGDTGFSAGGQVMAYVDPKEREIRSAQRDPQEQFIKNYFASFNRALTGPNWLDPVEGYAAYIDTDPSIDFHVLEVLSGNVDAIVLSTYFYKPRDGKIIFGPHWDFDRALGSTDGRDSNPRSWTTGPFFTGWWNRLCRDPDFWQKWIDRYQELRGSHLSRTYMNALIDRLSDEVRQAQPRERQKWRISPRGGSYQNEVNLMKNWLSNRTEFIDRQLVRPPALSAASSKVIPGFLVSISGPTNATIFYTVDGSDPRAAQGGVSSRARIYDGPLTVHENIRVKARARNLAQRQTGGPPISSPWSSAVSATYVVAPPPLLLTEVMFHPAESESAATHLASDVEFLELKNVSSEKLDLTGYRFTQGIEFAFTNTSGVSQLAPGERVLVVKNLAAFQSRYPGQTNIAGEFTGSLNNSGQRLALVGPVEEPVFDFRYEDDWQPLADGFGFSLVLRDETLSPNDLNEPTRWRLSAQVGGSPGRLDPVPPMVPQILVNELLANPLPAEQDALELFNPASQVVDISGWYLTDDFRVPKKYRLPNPTHVEAHGYLRLSSFSGNSASFGFNKFGEEVYLFSADAQGNLSGWFHGFEFGPAVAGVSFGRYVKSTYEEVLVAQQRTTLGTLNSGPQVGPVVLSEIALPPASDASSAHHSYIELYNMSAQPVPLYDLAHPTNPWRVRGSVDFDFPQGVTLGAKSYLVLVGFDPELDPTARARFRALYGVDSGVNLYGPWRGHLDASRQNSIRLLRPGEPEEGAASNSALVPQILVEQITYNDSRSWPLNSDASPWSLFRGDVAGYADDPISWIAASPSPGDADSDGDGLPDVWETHHHLNPHSILDQDGATGDPDNDGYTNLDEFRSGTAPDDSRRYLRLESAKVGLDKIVLSFQVIPDRSYTIEFRDSLTEGDWKVLQTIISPADVENGTVLEVPTSRQGFYRLLTP